MLEIEISRLALAEADVSRAWYEAEQEKFGEDFISELDRQIKAIQKNPADIHFIMRKFVAA
jgi:hypothetical protein